MSPSGHTGTNRVDPYFDRQLPQDKVITGVVRDNQRATTC